jgi:anhydro-N-acetylmuramic acid kinase
MIIDAAALALTGKNRDEGGRGAASGHVDGKLLEWMFAFDSEYLERKPPKSTGRERYNADYTAKLLAAAGNLPSQDVLATVTRYTAETIALGITKFCSTPTELYVSGGGVHNECLMACIRELLPRCSVRTGNDLGIPADAKEAAAFAILANETLHGLCNNAPTATGANHPVVMGKISF